MTNPLKQSISIIKGVGEDKATSLAEMNIYTVQDLLEHFPYRYEDFRLRDLSEVKHEEKITVVGKVHSEPSLTYFGRKRSRLTIRLLVDRYLIQVVLFNQPYLKKKITMNEMITVSGKWDGHRQMITANEVKIGQTSTTNDFEPVYAIKGKMTIKGIRRCIHLAFSQFGHLVEENIPESLQRKYKLLNRRDAFRALHFPSNQEELKQARRRFVYEEFLLFQLKMQTLRKMEREKSGGISQNFEREKVDGFILNLPFPLTNAQKRVVQEILADLTSPYRMNRLLQGDVGSGKTVVAAISLFASVSAGFQGALMVPTEILAEQHMESTFKHAWTCRYNL